MLYESRDDETMNGAKESTTRNDPPAEMNETDEMIGVCCPAYGVGRIKRNANGVKINCAHGDSPPPVRGIRETRTTGRILASVSGGMFGTRRQNRRGTRRLESAVALLGGLR